MLNVSIYFVYTAFCEVPLHKSTYTSVKWRCSCVCVKWECKFSCVYLLAGMRTKIITKSLFAGMQYFITCPVHLGKVGKCQLWIIFLWTRMEIFSCISTCGDGNQNDYKIKPEYKAELALRFHGSASRCVHYYKRYCTKYHHWKLYPMFQVNFPDMFFSIH